MRAFAWAAVAYWLASWATIVLPGGEEHVGPLTMAGWVFWFTLSARLGERECDCAKEVGGE